MLKLFTLKTVVLSNIHYFMAGLPFKYRVPIGFQVEGVEANEVAPRSEVNTGGTAVAARARLDAGGAHAGLLGGSPLTLLQGIIPGEMFSINLNK